MNKIEQPTSSFAFKVEDLMHMYNQTVVQQKAYGLALAQGTTGVYRVSGIVYDDSNPNFSITSGYVFYNEELFEVEAWAGVATGAQVPVWELHEVDGAHEPHNLYIGNSIAGTQAITKVRKLRPRLDASGTGIANIADTKDLPLVRLNDLYGLQSGMMVPYGKDFTLIASQFDGTGLGIGLFEGFAICNGQNGTPNMGGRVAVGYDNTDADYDTVGKVGGVKTVTLTGAQSGVAAHSHSITDPGHTHDLNVSEATPKIVGQNSGGGENAADDLASTLTTTSQTTGITINNAVEANAQQAHENRQPYSVVVWLMKI